MKDKIQMIVFVLVLGSVLTTALVSVHAITEPRIKKNLKMKVEGSVLKAAGIDFTEDTRSEVFSREIEEKVFADKFQDKGVAEEDKKKFYVTTAGEMIFEYRGSGLQDEIYGAIAFERDLETIKGITIIKQNETPGLGGRIKEAAFLDQFKGKKMFPELRITGEGKAGGDNEVNGMTGATMSCNAFEEVLNEESQYYIEAIKESLK